MKAQFFVLGLLVGNFCLAEQKIFTYTWAGYPVFEQKCQSEAEKVAVLFSAQTGKEIFRAAGIKEHNACRIRISYVSDKPVGSAISTNWYPVGWDPAEAPLDLDYDPWLYKTQKECDESLSAQVELFEREVGIKPIIAHCYKPANRQGPVLRIVGFGESKRRPRHFQIPQVYEDQSQFNASIASTIAALGGTVFLVSSTQGTGIFASNWIHYYHDQETLPLARLEKLGALAYPDQQACTSALPEIVEILASFGSESIASSCIKPRYEGASAYLELIYRQSTEIQWVSPPDSDYSSLEQCAAQKESVAKFYIEKLQVDVRGALCIYVNLYSGKFYRLWLLYAKPVVLFHQ